MIVVDATALVDLLLGKPQASELVAELAGADPMHVPEVTELEALNSLRRLVRHEKITADDGDKAVKELGDLALVRDPHEPLRERIWALRHNLSAYDASYLALVETLDDSVLVTGDAGLYQVAVSSLGADRVRKIS